MVNNIKRWIEKCIYDASEILFGIKALSKQIQYSNNILSKQFEFGMVTIDNLPLIFVPFLFYVLWIQSVFFFHKLTE